MSQVLIHPASSGGGLGVPNPQVPSGLDCEKPRLARYRALLSYDYVDLDLVVEAHREWCRYPEWLIFQGEHRHTGEIRFKGVKSAKRGNDVYAWRIRNRMAGLIQGVPDTMFFPYRDRSKRHRTRALFVTLTMARDRRLDLAWEEIGAEYNRYMSRLRRRYGPVHGFRVFEAQRDGYPHIHAMLVFESASFEVFHHEGCWRVQGKRDMEDLWPWGFSDYEGLAGVRTGLRYMVKYLSKIHKALGPGTSPPGGRSPLGAEASGSPSIAGLQYSSSQLTIPLMWIFRRRAFGVSKGFIDSILERTNSNTRGPGVLDQVDLEGDPVWSWRLMGFWGGYLGPRWSRSLSLGEYRRIKGSSSWTSRP